MPGRSELGLPDGAPDDVYDIAAAPIVLRLINDVAITTEQLDSIWR